MRPLIQKVGIVVWLVLVHSLAKVEYEAYDEVLFGNANKLQERMNETLLKYTATRKIALDQIKTISQQDGERLHVNNASIVACLRECLSSQLISSQGQEGQEKLDALLCSQPTSTEWSGLIFLLFCY